MFFQLFLVYQQEDVLAYCQNTGIFRRAKMLGLIPYHFILCYANFFGKMCKQIIDCY